MKSSSKSMGHSVRLVVRDKFLLRSPKQLEDAGPAMLRSQVRHARNDMEVDVREAFGLGELDDVGLGAASRAPESTGELDLPHPQGRSLGVGEIVNRDDVAPGQQHQPARHCGIEGVGHSPVLVVNHALARRQGVEVRFLAACVAVGSRHERRS